MTRAAAVEPAPDDPIVWPPMRDGMEIIAGPSGDLGVPETGG